MVASEFVGTQGGRDSVCLGKPGSAAARGEGKPANADCWEPGREKGGIGLLDGK